VSIREKYDQITVPALIIGGWYNYYQGETFNNFVGLMKQAKTAAIQQSRQLIMGPWSHSVCESTQRGELDFGRNSILDLNELYPPLV
jgi:hypothetical protein